MQDILHYRQNVWLTAKRRGSKWKKSLTPFILWSCQKLVCRNRFSILEQFQLDRPDRWSPISAKGHHILCMEQRQSLFISIQSLFHLFFAQIVNPILMYIFPHLRSKPKERCSIPPNLWSFKIGGGGNRILVFLRILNHGLLLGSTDLFYKLAGNFLAKRKGSQISKSVIPW